tara:strand:- start:103 stop:207 length:105 start_codon:yes stop_codon:yes gene_type:complete
MSQQVDPAVALLNRAIQDNLRHLRNLILGHMLFF